MNNLTRWELRAGWLGIPRPFSAFDLIGVAMGAAMIYTGASPRAPRWLPIALGGTMIFIHAQRFFYAPQDRAGLMALMRELEVTPAELTELAPQLARRRLPAELPMG